MKEVIKMDTQNQNGIWRNLDELYMDLGEWIPFFEKLLENGQLKFPTQIVFGNLTLEELIKMIKKDLNQYKKLLKTLLAKKKDKQEFEKIILTIIKLVEGIERRISDESI